MSVSSDFFVRIVLFSTLFCTGITLYRSKDVFSCFVLHSNEFLEKSGNVLIENVDDVNECMRKCIQAPMIHKIKCQTVMYNVNTKNCVLSKYSREERKVKKSKGLQIDLYENKCEKENETIKLAVFIEQVRTTATPYGLRNETVLATTTTPVTNELRRAHAVKQYPLDRKKENVIYSKTILAEARDFSKPRPKVRNARVFLSPRPLVDSTSSLQSDDIQKLRRQRSEEENENFAACFVRSPNRVLAKFEETKVVGLNLEGCIKQCAQNANFYCASINYSHGLKTCILNGGNVHLNSEELLMSRDFDYFENTCQPKASNTPRIANGVSTKKECYRLYNNTIYNSFDATIVGGLTTLESCESECSWSHIRRNEKCIGINWVATTNGCMLFHKPIDFSVLVPSFKSIFLVNICTQATNESRRPKGSDPDYYE